MGKIIMSGIVPQLTAPEIPVITGSELAVGSVVKLMENGSAVEYMVVHKGRPSTAYDTSCDGIWMMRKALYPYSAYGANTLFHNSHAKTYLNGTFYNLFGSVEKEVIKQVKIPYQTDQASSPTVNTGANGLSVNVFLLSYTELGFTSSSYCVEGAKLSYFTSGNATAANNKRIAYLNGTATAWWTRTAGKTAVYLHPAVDVDGDSTNFDISEVVNTAYMRPVIILPNNAVFDEATLILKGVA